MQISKEFREESCVDFQRKDMSLLSTCFINSTIGYLSQQHNSTNTLFLFNLILESSQQSYKFYYNSFSIYTLLTLLSRHIRSKDYVSKLPESLKYFGINKTK